MTFLKNKNHFLAHTATTIVGPETSHDFLSKEGQLMVTTYSTKNTGVFSIEAHDFVTEKRLLIYKNVLGKIKTVEQPFGATYDINDTLRGNICEDNPKKARKHFKRLRFALGISTISP